MVFEIAFVFAKHFVQCVQLGGVVVLELLGDGALGRVGIVVRCEVRQRRW